ncbi:nucleotide sugar dehydrogenase [Sphingopyxis sp. YF1]|uniref:nucleotide sugar dehydrogenase n=1 Tax=Sphingopyxis sp. YF1 TaxID=2482763 RepID=UPI001F608F37|nr:nucleotide sugar dehydrogenase [Sphingopyxis sp. YF1]UNU42685.1 nucleotide sugar dehydrogenase [Sphingopyxis sp. YF1]
MKIVVVGLGYVGLPLAVQLAKHFDTVGLDSNAARIAELAAGHDRTGEVDADGLAQSALALTSAAEDCRGADLYIVTVPTPIDADNRPDLSPVRSATRTVAALIDPARTPTIVYESTVYPGVTEDICGPMIEELSGLKRGRDFFLGYSPERINPGDREHTVDRIMKVLAGENDAVTELLATVYGKVTSGGVFRARSIRAAEAAKVIENAQRDINIAFINEVTKIFSALDISVWDVLDAARTKWNFLPFEPGLVGGHCIGVDPYYLSHRAQELGIDPQVVLSGRATNDGMAQWMADELHRALAKDGADILILGLTFKENVPDLRNSKVIDLVTALRRHGHRVAVHDPHADPAEARHEYDLELTPIDAADRYDCVIGAVRHDSFRALETADFSRILRPGGLIADLKRMWRDAADVAVTDLRYWSI